MEHYLTDIHIEKLRHLRDVHIELDRENRQHLLITGKNGCGKTTLLNAMRQYLAAINDGNLNKLKNDYVKWLNNSKKKLKNAKTENEKFWQQKEYDQDLGRITKYKNGLDLQINGYEDLDAIYARGDFILAYFPAYRRTKMNHADGVQNIYLQESYTIDSEPGNDFVKYMVHLKTQQSYAQIE